MSGNLDVSDERLRAMGYRDVMKVFGRSSEMVMRKYFDDPVMKVEREAAIRDGAKHLFVVEEIVWEDVDDVTYRLTVWRKTQ